MDPASYNKEVGEHWALEDAISQVWPLLAYQLKEEMYQDAPPKEEEMNFRELVDQTGVKTLAEPEKVQKPTGKSKDEK